MAIKSLGQHWLKNREILNEIAALAGHGPLCLEIGPGLGTLTSSLLKNFTKVIAVEFDENLAKNLPKSFPGKNLEVINADILKFDLTTIEPGYVVAGNIPYYITSPILEKLLTTKNPPKSAVLLMQKEVAERICDSKSSVLSLFVKNRAVPTLGPIVLREEFEPAPKVDSQVLILNLLDAPRYEEGVLKLVKIAFSSPRKKLVHNLSVKKPKSTLIPILHELNLSPDARPSDLTLDDYAKLFQKLV